MMAHVMVWLVGCISLWFAWTGLIASDDLYYVNAARGWLHSFPYVADNIGTARFVVALPIAAMFALFGDSEFTSVLSTCLFLLGTASLTLSLLTPRIGLRDASIASATLLTVPLFALKSTIPSADLPELFFAVLSLWLFLKAGEQLHRTLLLILAGGSAGLSFLAHETAAALLVFYGLLFIVGTGIRRREYFVMTVGFAVVMAAECLYYWIVVGDPLHRLAMLSGAARSTGDRIHVGFLEIGAGGTIHVWTPIDPILMFFTKQEFALLGLVATPAMVWALRRPGAKAQEPRIFARLFGAFGIVWFAFAAVILNKLILLPRYYMAPAYCFFVVSAIWMSTIVYPRYPRIAVVLIAAFIGANLIAVEIDNKNPRFGERALVDYLRQSQGPVYTDPSTAYYVDTYAEWGGVDYRRVKASPPTPGIAYFYNPRNADRASRLVRPVDVKQYAPPPAWKVVWRRQESPKRLGTLLSRTGLIDRIPPGLASKLVSPNPAVAVYQAD